MPLAENHVCTQKILPYNIRHLSKVMYISGAYWAAKKEVMLEFPIKEDLDYEDVEWSIRCRDKYEFSLNYDSKVFLLKQADKVWDYISDDVAEKLRLI
jgi:hypothetical protein